MRGAGSAATLQRLQESLPREAAHHPRPAALIGCGAGRRPPPANRPAPTMGGAAAPASPIPRPRGPRPPRRAGPAGGSAGGFPAARRSSTPWVRRAGSSGDRRGAGSRLARGCQGGGELGARCRCRARRCAALPLRRARPAEPWQWSGCAARGERTVRVRRPRCFFMQREVSSPVSKFCLTTASLTKWAVTSSPVVNKRLWHLRDNEHILNGKARTITPFPPQKTVHITLHAENCILNFFS
ncbi:uncharacterized protein LOC128073300 [Tympanuchus pallidicinctus]|uniref:uncharacterized protein LOC128073300 n=1 Tax=Tympanuchus pallidicinctus TaxID=109042 RepID=UPI002286E496|nr:uncharacterized protein LOC128073300 [Tympanuchus pallidicinctus]